MNKAEAIEKMTAGEKVTHHHFSPDEWVTMKDGKMVLEDGVKCSPLEFWRWRTDASWDNDWELFEEPEFDRINQVG